MHRLHSLSSLNLDESGMGGHDAGAFHAINEVWNTGISKHYV